VAGHSRSKNGVASLAYVPAIPIKEALCLPKRDARVKPAHDAVSDSVQAEHALGCRIRPAYDDRQQKRKHDKGETFMTRRVLDGLATAGRAVLSALVVILLTFASARAAGPIKIGFSMPLSGALASTGKAILAAYQMWEEDVNAKGGLIGRPVKLVYYDDQSNPTLVPAIYAKLFDVDKVDVMLSSYGTNLTAPVMPVAIPRNLVVMGLFALAINDQFNYPYYFSMFPAGPDAVHEFSRGYFEIAREQKLQTVAIVGADSDFAKKAADGAHDNASKMGFKIVYERGYPPNTLDFSPILRAVQAANPDVVYVASYPTDSVGIVRAAHEIGLKTRMFGGGMVGLQYAALKTQLGELLNRTVNYDFYVPEPTVPFPGIADFLKRYQEKATAGGMDALGFFVPPFAYANTQVLAQAIEAVGGIDQKKLGDYLKTHSFKTMVGDVRYAANGEWADPRVLFVQFQGVTGNGLDQFKKAGTQVIVYPKDIASGALQFPYAEAR
jgi:branched-chain amino acid transport system substrate-binding protein